MTDATKDADPTPTPTPVLDKAQTEAVEAAVKAYLDANLEELVKAAMPETPEQQAKRQRESEEEAVRKRTQAAARKAKREATARAKAEADAAKEQAKRDADAAKAFADATPFVGKVEDLKASIVRGIAVDDGEAYSADLDIAVRFSELEPTNEGALVLNKEVVLPARGREFSVKGISLLTDAGRMRIVLGGARKCGGGRAISFPPKSLVFRPHTPEPEAE